VKSLRFFISVERILPNMLSTKYEKNIYDFDSGRESLHTISLRATSIIPIETFGW